MGLLLYLVNVYLLKELTVTLKQGTVFGAKSILVPQKQHLNWG